eukprot:COSAG01_NODE_30704_length_610_cov_135.818004_1_plen_81_part_10
MTLYFSLHLRGRKFVSLLDTDGFLSSTICCNRNFDTNNHLLLLPPLLFIDTHAHIDTLCTRAHWTVTTHAPMPHVFTMGLD